MLLGKEIYNLQGRMNNGQSNSVMLEIMTSKMTIDLNVFSSLMKNRVVSNMNRTLVVTIHRSRMRKEKKTLISASNQRNQTISLVVDAMTEAEGKSKYQILQKRKTKYHSKFFYFSCRNLIQIPNCRN